MRDVVATLHKAKYTAVLKSGERITVLAMDEADAKRELRWIAPDLPRQVDHFEVDHTWSLRGDQPAAEAR